MVKFLRRHKLGTAAVVGGLLLYVIYRLGTVYFAQGFYNCVSLPLMKALRFVSDLCPFGLTEWVIGLFALGCVALVVYLIVMAVKKRGQGYVVSLVLAVIAACILVYDGYCYLWGSSYYVPTLRQNAEIDRQQHSVTQLYELTCKYALALNQSHTQIDKEAALNATSDLLMPLKEQYGLQIEKEYGVKGLTFSRALSYMGFTGFYFPFTGECNINTDIPASSVPATVAHELAHRAGVAAEDEANFVAIMACLQSGDKDFVYSGNMMAFSYLHSALYQNDKELWEKAVKLLEKDVVLEISARSKYWEQFETPIEKLWSATYDNFLQSFDQKDGIATYGNVVALLLDTEYTN